MSLGFDDDLLYEQRTTPKKATKVVVTGRSALRFFTEALGSRLRENRKLHYRTEFQGLPISVENRKGSIRRGKDPDGNDWATKHKVPYGYIPGTKGPDGDAVDVFVGKNPDAAYAYVIHINNPKSGEYDEYKVFLGFDTEGAAINCFRQHYDEPHKFFRSVDQIPMWEFQDKVWVKKETTERLLASLRESKKRAKKKKGSIQVVVNVDLGGATSERDPENEVKAAFLPAGSYAGNRMKETWGFSSKSLQHEETRHGGQAHLFTSRRIKEKGVKGMKWGSHRRAEVALMPKATASDLSQALRTENLHLRAKMRGEDWSEKQKDMARERIRQNEEMIEHYDKQSGGRESRSGRAGESGRQNSFGRRVHRHSAPEHAF